MKMRTIVIFSCILHACMCQSMEQFLDARIENIRYAVNYVVAKANGEEHLLEKPKISPLPTIHLDILQNVAGRLDGSSMSNFASCCKGVHNTLNSSYRWAEWWHQDGYRAPVKIIKDYVAHNEALIADLIKYQEQDVPVLAARFADTKLANPNYCRLGRRYWDGKFYDDDNLHLNKCIKTVSDEERPCFDKSLHGHVVGTQNMLDVVCSQTQSVDAVSFLLKQGAYIQYAYSGNPIMGAIIAYDEVKPPLNLNKPFAGDLSRCTTIIDILCAGGCDIHSNSKSIISSLLVHAYAHLLLPYLIKKGFNPNYVDGSGKTLLHRFGSVSKLQATRKEWPITKQNMLTSIQILIEAKADPTMQDNKNKTMLDYMPAALHSEVQAIIDTYAKKECT